MKFGMLIRNIIPYGPRFTFFRNSYFWLIYAILKAQNLYINRRFSSPGFIQSPIELAQWNLVCAFVSSFPMDRDLLFFSKFLFLSDLGHFESSNLYINRRFSSPGFIQSPIELPQWNFVYAFVSSFPMEFDLVLLQQELRSNTFTISQHHEIRWPRCTIKANVVQCVLSACAAYACLCQRLRK